jgi:hypothetical protein
VKQKSRQVLSDSQLTEANANETDQCISQLPAKSFRGQGLETLRDTYQQTLRTKRDN